MTKLLWGAVVLAFIAAAAPCPAAGWKAGVASVVITPSQPTWMAGYASRTKPAEGKLHDLKAKALTIEDGDGHRAVLVTLDVCGIGQPLSNEIRDVLRAKHGLDRPQVALACSHTHSGPVVGTNLLTMYPLDDEQRERIADYALFLRDRVIEVVGRSLDDLKPASLSWETGRCDFAVNRRENDQSRAAELREALALKGPIDHDVPVLKVAGADGAIRAIIYGYACHCTTLQGYETSNDYAGFASLAIERAHPGATALFVAGCGADQNPLPRGKVADAERYGSMLARSVELALAGPLRAISGDLKTVYEEIPLALSEIPNKDHWESEAKSSTPAVANRAKMLLRRIAEEGGLPTTYPYPIQVWTLGDGPLWVLLGGEVVVDYSLRLKRNLGTSRTWVSAYCNDVMAYIPSLRVLKEGGYEGGGAMVYYGLPAYWSERVEEQLVDAVRRLAVEARPAAEHRTAIPTR